MKKLILATVNFTVCILVSNLNFAQNISPATQPNTLIVKFKKETISQFELGRIKSPAFEKIFDSLSIKKFKQILPNSTPEKSYAINPLARIKNLNNSKKLVDLSSVYEISYDGNKNSKEIISQLKKSGLVEYAEPKFIDQLTYIPNDPEANPVSGKQYHLAVIKAYQAWDVEKGDSNMVIGVVDTDMNLNHPDLKGQAKINTLDPINGVDDDNDGYIDNYQGWDLGNDDNDVNAKEATISITSGGNKKDTVVNGNGHGSIVFGNAAAKTDNNVGIAGAGFNCKVMPIKAMKDSDAIKGIITEGYLGIVYAAENGAKVINCSWGSFNSYSLLAQEIINYATYNFDALVVAAAGNDDKEDFLYPCSYENVMCVAASAIDKNTKKDIKASWATHSNMVDVCAPGDEIYLIYKDAYTIAPGSSYAAPLVAGTAALVRNKFKDFNALQTLEQLRVTADNIDTIAGNEKYAEKMGKGRLNMFRALTETGSPSIKMVEHNFPNFFGTVAYANNSVQVFGRFVNYLSASTNAKVSVSTKSPYIKMMDSTFTIGKLATLDTASNINSKFSFKVSGNIPINHIVYFRIGFEDGNYKDYQYIRCFFNPDFIDLDTNQITASITSNGRVGFRDDNSSEGAGLLYKNSSLLFESGLVISASDNKLSDCVRSAPTSFNYFSFASSQTVRYVQSEFKGQEIFCELNDTSKNKVGLNIKLNAYALPNTPNDKYFVVRYLIKNTSGNDIDSLRVGLYSDWDIGNSSRNRADYDAATKTAFTFSAARNGLYAGVTLLSDIPVSVCSHDHSDNISGNINPNDGFTDAEKKRALFGGVVRARAGFTGFGNDVSQTIGGVFTNFKKDEIRQVAFAYLAGDNKADILASAESAKNIFKSQIEPTSIVEQLCSQDILLSPNPALDYINITYPNLTTPSWMYLENMLGSNINKVLLEGNSHQLNIEKLEKGMYLIKIPSKTGWVIKKFVKN